MTQPDAAIVGSRLLGRPVRVVERLGGGTHAVTTVLRDGARELVLRQFPAGDAAVGREVRVLAAVAPLGALAPALIGYDLDPDAPCIVTNRLPGGHPAPDLAADAIAAGMATVVARIHELDGAGLPVLHAGHDAVLTHSDFWSGNVLWTGDRPCGVVDWSGAGRAPRGVDVAWCRLDLVLLGHPAAADAFGAEYRARSGAALPDLARWDRLAAQRAAAIVATWAPNYAGIGRPELTAAVLRARLDAWTSALLR